MESHPFWIMMGQYTTERFGAIKVHVCGSMHCSPFEPNNYIIHVWDRDKTFTLIVPFTGWLYECCLSAKLQETISKLTDFVVEYPGGEEDEQVLGDLILNLERLNAEVIEISNDNASSDTDTEGDECCQPGTSGSKGKAVAHSLSSQAASSKLKTSALAKCHPPWIIDHVVHACHVVGDAALDGNLTDPSLLEKISNTSPPTLTTHRRTSQSNSTPAKSEWSSGHSSQALRSSPHPAAHHCPPAPSPTPAQFSIAPTLVHPL
ncbi:hypothetical protein GYMLUDRAFT_251149 [Collybiopsis luxurians FD-317 M1]|uniref:Uncharacterized protein n=1 Tax=Collybiopsis luxurians FD-317 M1 TaxID=944289 RepID=A0A0D0BSH2_9AGAR|nr:hypothetical protein GYMLUDRAFT_251149 [Collybiopsis luxurians FD-317 M1]